MARCLGSCLCLPQTHHFWDVCAISFGSTKAITICICLLLFAFGSGKLSKGKKGLFPILKGLARSTGMLECGKMFNRSCVSCVFLFLTFNLFVLLPCVFPHQGFRSGFRIFSNSSFVLIVLLIVGPYLVPHACPSLFPYVSLLLLWLDIFLLHSFDSYSVVR